MTPIVRLRACLIAAVSAAVLAAGTPAVLAQQAPAAGETEFVGDIEDLPLMPGLTEITGAGMVFDTPAGRIVQALASGNVSRAQVLAFYAATLPQLGWQPAGKATYRREAEVLVLEFPPPGDAGGLTVRFALSPAKADPSSQ